jgi:stalled ribosome rescue protein Dom34
MSGKNSKQFGVWLDSSQATIVGREDVDSGEFVVIGQAKNAGQGSNSNENTAHNAEQGLQQKFFKEITALMQNAEDVHVTGTGITQEQFIHYLADQAQFKNTQAQESTSHHMSDENLLEYISEQFN